MSPPDVVVTGLGATTPLGGDVASTWEAMLTGESGVRALPYDWAHDLPVRIAAELVTDPATILDRVRMRRLDRSEAVAIVAARQAWRDAGFGDAGPADAESADAGSADAESAESGSDESESAGPASAGTGPDRERLAVSVGTGIGGALTLLAQDDRLETSGPRRVSPHTIPMLMPNGPSAQVGLEFGAQAGVHSVASACATGAEAIAQGLDIIRSGRADVVLAGGVEAVIHQLPLAGFAAMRALSTRNDEPERASRPWDKNRDGFVLGEGAGVLVLERAEHAAARGAPVYARLAGAGVTSDGYDIVQPDPSGAGAARAIAAALRDSDVAASDVAHVNAHATSTAVGDLAEVTALHEALGDHPVLTATKSLTGHLLGAAGAVEAIATILAIRDHAVPPTRNLDDPDDALDLDVAAHTAREMPIPAALNNAFGFGGHNIALLFTRA